MNVGQPGWDAAEGAPAASHGSPAGSPQYPGDAAPPPAPGGALATDSQARDIATWTHLSALIALVGIPSALGPLVVWLVKREAHPFVDAQGKEALNFNLSVLIYALGLGVFGVVFSLVTLGIGLFVLIPLFILAAIAWLVAVVVAAVKASRGEMFRYPLTIRMVR